MPEKPQPDRAPDDDETPPHPAEPLQIDTPVIDIEDADVTRAAQKIEPRMDSADERDFAREDAWAIAALEEFEKSLSRQLPG
jgi:hypothetical protein